MASEKVEQQPLHVKVEEAAPSAPPPYATQAQPHQSQPQPYPTKSQPFPTQAHNYPPQGQQYPPQGQYYPPQGQPYPGQGQPYPGQGQHHPGQGQQYPTHPGQYPPQAYGKPADPAVGYWHPQQPGYTGVPQSDRSSGVPGQPGVVIIPQKGQQMMVMRERESFVKHIVLSCVVSWCCCWPLGLVAFILAMVANSRANLTDEQSVKSAHELGVHSIRTSIAGIILGVILIVTYVILQVVVLNNQQY